MCAFASCAVNAMWHPHSVCMHGSMSVCDYTRIYACICNVHANTCVWVDRDIGVCVRVCVYACVCMFMGHFSLYSHGLSSISVERSNCLQRRSSFAHTCVSAFAFTSSCSCMRVFVLHVMLKQSLLRNT